MDDFLTNVRIQGARPTIKVQLTIGKRLRRAWCAKSFKEYFVREIYVPISTVAKEAVVE